MDQFVWIHLSVFRPKATVSVLLPFLGHMYRLPAATFEYCGPEGKIRLKRKRQSDNNNNDNNNNDDDNDDDDDHYHHHR